MEVWEAAVRALSTGFHIISSSTAYKVRHPETCVLYTLKVLQVTSPPRRKSLAGPPRRSSSGSTPSCWPRRATSRCSFSWRTTGRWTSSRAAAAHSRSRCSWFQMPQPSAASVAPCRRDRICFRYDVLKFNQFLPGMMGFLAYNTRLRSSGPFLFWRILRMHGYAPSSTPPRSRHTSLISMKTLETGMVVAMQMSMQGLGRLQLQGNNSIGVVWCWVECEVVATAWCEGGRGDGNKAHKDGAVSKSIFDAGF